MRLLLQKPKDGKTSIDMNDRQGITGLRLRAEDVAVEDVGSVATALATQYNERRKKIYDAKKGRSL